MKPETRLVRRITETLKADHPGSFWFKVHGGPFQLSGLPDLMGCVRGTFVGIEVKMPGGRPTALQAHRLGQIRKAGGIAICATSAQEASRLLAEALKDC